MAKPRGRVRRRDTGEPRPQRDAGQRPPLEPSRIEIACWVVLLSAALAALIWNHHTQFFYSWTDEQIHFYVANRMAQGAVLYRDIESARPPLVLFPLAWLIRLGASPLLAGRALVVGAQIATGGLLIWGGWRLASFRVGALAALLFLTSPEVYARVHYTGIHLVAVTACACLLFALRGRPAWAGLFFGLTVVTDQHGLVVCAIAALFTFARSRRDGLRFAMTTLLVSTTIFGSIWLIGGRHLWASLVGVHLHHLRLGQGVGAQFWQRFIPWIYEHGYLFVGAGLAMLLERSRRTQAMGGDSTAPAHNVRVLLLAVGAHVAVALSLSEAVFLYVVVIAPLLALLAGMGFDGAVAWWRQRRQLSKDRSQRVSRLMLAGTLATLIVTAGGWARARARREDLDHRNYSFWPYLLHGQVSRSYQLDSALREISESMLPEVGTIFGDATIVSALALRSRLRVSGELADLNPNWLEAGTVKAEDVVSRIETDGVAAVITPPFGLVQNPYFKAYLFACYEKPKAVFPPQDGPGEGLTFFMVFTHVRGTTSCHPTPGVD